jgi:hypothetical protein
MQAHTHVNVSASTSELITRLDLSFKIKHKAANFLMMGTDWTENFSLFEKISPKCRKHGNYLQP